MNREIGEQGFTQTLFEGDKVEVYDARKYRVKEDGTVDPGEIITTGLVIDVGVDDIGFDTGLVTINTLEDEIITSEHNFKLLSEGHYNDVYTELTKDKVQRLREELKLYKDVTSLREGELDKIVNEMERLEKEYMLKIKPYNNLVEETQKKADELYVLTNKTADKYTGVRHKPFISVETL